MTARDILSIPLPEIYPERADAVSDLAFVYSPLADACAVVSASDAARLADGAPERTADPAFDRFFRQKVSPVMAMRRFPEESRSLVFLLNQKCNFSCRYCYSAQGRSSAELEAGTADRVLASFVRRWRGGCGCVSFGGGGDPLMSWPLLRHLLRLARSLAAECDVGLDLVVTTNGSLITDEIIDEMLASHVALQVSFDILPDIQESQRGHFDTVAANVDRLLERGLVPNVSCVITPSSVERQREIVAYCLERFPRLRHASFDYVKDYVRELTMCENVERLSSFLERFYVNFHAARDFAAASGFRLSSPFERKIGSCKTFGCEGNFVVTPNGDVTACPRVSSPREPAFSRMRIGRLDGAGAFSADAANWRRWREAGWPQHTECADCIAKWNCGGGCPLERELFAPEMREVICTFTRRFIVRRLIADRNLLGSQRHV